MSGCFGRINVSGPGQNFAVSWFTFSAMSSGIDRHIFQIPSRADVDDERVERGPLLRRENLRNRFRIQRIAASP